MCTSTVRRLLATLNLVLGVFFEVFATVGKLVLVIRVDGLPCLLPLSDCGRCGEQESEKEREAAGFNPSKDNGDDGALITTTRHFPSSQATGNASAPPRPEVVVGVGGAS